MQVGQMQYRFRNAVNISRGFTLIELMVVVVIIAILAGIGYPMYLDQMKKSRRSDAKTTLSDVAARMEQFYQNNNGYTTDLTLLGYTANPFTTDQAGGSGYYTISVAAPNAACPIATCFSLEADPRLAQVDDTQCDPLVYTSNGGKTPTSCW